MPTALESKVVMGLLADQAVETTVRFAERLPGSPDVRRQALLEVVPDVIGYYSDGTSALAADFYNDERALASAPGSFTATPVVLDRTVKIRRGIAWASEPWFVALGVTTAQRLAEVVQLEVARPYRDTILTNRRRDPATVGWRRVTTGGCKFCRMLADRGAVYKESTARFAAHTGCHCTAEPVFNGTAIGPEASVMQYMASQSSRTASQRAELRSYLNTFYPEFPG